VPKVDFLVSLFVLFNLINQIFMTGTIKKITDKGFGFITAEGMAKDLFFHSNSLVGVSFDEIREGDTVSFDTEDSPKGMSAVNVQRA
jgi:CspA family cold shock protein